MAHGGRVQDDNGDEDDGYDETLIPIDFQRKGQIRDDDLLRYLVKPMGEGVLMTCLMDCCHSIVELFSICPIVLLPMEIITKTKWKEMMILIWII